MQSPSTTAIFTIVSTGFAALGALIFARQPGNAVGWLFIAAALFLSLSHNLAQNYAVYALVAAPRSAPGGLAAYWLSSTALDGAFLLLVALLLVLFPDGRPIVPRLRVVVWGALAGFVLSLGFGLVRFTSEAPLDGIDNPLATSGLAASVLSAIAAAGVIAILGAGVVGVVSVVVRFRRSTGIERQQVKWIVLGMLVVGLVSTVSVILSLAGLGDYSGEVFVATIVLFPTMMGVAILRYRLYDIDVVIRRTLVYACLIAVLAVLYLGGIALLGAGLRSAIGQSGALSVTLSTLGVILAFQPLRRRIQFGIDRRFSRRTYDAEATVRAFAVRLREEVDLDVLSPELIRVVHDTLQPHHAALWLRPPAESATALGGDARRTPPRRAPAPRRPRGS